MGSDSEGAMGARVGGREELLTRELAAQPGWTRQVVDDAYEGCHDEESTGQALVAEEALCEGRGEAWRVAIYPQPARRELTALPRRSRR